QRAGFCASAGDGSQLQGPSAGRRLRHPRLARHRVRRGRPVMMAANAIALTLGTVATITIAEDHPATRGIQDLLDHRYEVVAEGMLVGAVECTPQSAPIT